LRHCRSFPPCFDGTAAAAAAANPLGQPEVALFALPLYPSRQPLSGVSAPVSPVPAACFVGGDDDDDDKRTPSAKMHFIPAIFDHHAAAASWH